MKICDAKDRDCIEDNSAKTFNCNTTCVGIYADVQWIGQNIEQEFEEEKAHQTLTAEGEIGDSLLKRVLHLEREIKLCTGQRGDELDKEKYKMLISEYRKFKTKNVKNFRFNSAAGLSTFGKSLLGQLPEKISIICKTSFEWSVSKTKIFFFYFAATTITFGAGEEFQSTLQLVEIYFDTATFDDIERDKKIKTEAQLSLIGGTMGLLTGFSIISGVEIIFFLLRLIRMII